MTTEMAWLSDIRRDLHMHPELSQKEVRTTERIIAILKEAQVEVRPLADMTGAVGLIRGEAGGPTLALRADIDALPIQELNDVGYRSRNEGVMHACGHDAHTTIALGVARRIASAGLPARFKGNLKLLFQPSEERASGAKEMIKRGVLENPSVDRVIAAHMGPDLPLGKAGISKGHAFASSDRLMVTIKGRGAHGGRPDQGIDPIVAGAYFITQIQTLISRNLPPAETGVITIGRFTAGEASNVIPESAYLEGSIRTLSTDVRKLIIERLTDIGEGLEKTFQVTCEVNIREGLPGCANDEAVAQFLFEAAAAVLGPENVTWIPPTTGSEDFAYFAEACPGAIMRLGCGNEAKGIRHPLHSPRFDIDEQVLPLGVEIFSEAVRRYLR